MGKTKNICILGSTGSIGQNSLEVIARFPELFRLTSLTSNTNIDLLEQQIARFKPINVAVLNESAAALLKHRLNGSVKLYVGERGLQELVRQDEADVVINSLVGFAGLKPTIEAIKQGKTIALANKETLVVAGELITSLLKQYNAKLIPIDSEHSAILQCLAGENADNISRLILTASGGPFFHLDKSEFGTITVEAALKHPNWNMGSKITIDSATMMNKGLEVIEAHYLFNLPPGKIEVVIHPQSIIHSMVEFVDGSVKAQLGIPDMKIPIQYALTYPERLPAPHPRVSFAKLREMTFFEPDNEKFPCLALAFDALREGGTAPAILNAANEVAVELFLHRTISFTQIPELIKRALESIPKERATTLEPIIAADKATREFVLTSVKRIN
ncbi:MAG: 1-deoxy-D-xylulose-5-phosphate reductoisomerase [Ignavibacteriales bacterium]|nr:1-deoxy-D-xylulose-5-phosphate reductoisomerase [Ignavibacteriales bacterium]